MLLCIQVGTEMLLNEDWIAKGRPTGNSNGSNNGKIDLNAQANPTN